MLDEKVVKLEFVRKENVNIQLEQINSKYILGLHRESSADE